MRLASSNRLSGAALLAASLLAGSSYAATVFTDWSVSSDGSRETIELRWSESSPVQLEEFAQARQAVAVFPGASLKHGVPTRLRTDSPMLDRVRLQEVTLPHGESAVQLTVQFSNWSEIKSETHADRFVISYELPAAPAAPLTQGRGLELTDEKVSQMLSAEFGAAQAPRTGAGQATGSVTEFYVPPNVERARRSAADAQTIADLGVDEKLNELVRRVDFQGTSLENVLRLISEEAELNIIITPADVAGRNVTLRLRNVTLRQMLDAILKANNLGYTIEEGGIIRIVPRDQVKSTIREVIVETIPVNWVDATDLKAALDPLVNREADGSIEVLRSNNMLIVRDVPENVQEIQKLVDLLDVPEKQVLIEMRLVNMSESARRGFGTRTGFESGSEKTRSFRDPNASFFDQREFANRETTISNTFSDTLNNTFNTAGGIVGPGAGLPTFSQNNAMSRTGDVTLDQTVTQSLQSVPATRGSAGLLATQASAFQFSKLFTADVLGTKYDVELAINAEENRGEAVTIANPTVLSLNNQEAIVEIKRQIPYVSAVNSDQGSVATVEFKDVGTEVVILPRITNNGYIQMNIQPEQIIDTGLRPGGVPVTDERRVTSSVIVRDEQTIALGGLREFTSNASENGVPYLLRLPVLSWLFKNQSNEQTKTELYLFVTPQIVKDPTPSAYQTALYEKLDYNWDLPDYWFDEITPRKAPGEELGPGKR